MKEIIKLMLMIPIVAFFLGGVAFKLPGFFYDRGYREASTTQDDLINDLYQTIEILKSENRHRAKRITHLEAENSACGEALEESSIKVDSQMAYNIRLEKYNRNIKDTVIQQQALVQCQADSILELIGHSQKLILENDVLHLTKLQQAAAMEQQLATIQSMKPLVFRTVKAEHKVLLMEYLLLIIGIIHLLLFVFRLYKNRILLKQERGAPDMSLGNA